MLINRRRLQQLQGTLIGLAIAAGTTIVFFARDTEPRLELMSFDWRMRNFNTLEADPRIVHVDIDDGSLDRIGRWPWSRSQMADLIRAISDFEPQLILVDFLFSEPEKLQWDDPRLEADGGEAVEMIGELSASNLIQGDLELADSVRDARRVIMAAQIDVRAPGEPLPLAQRIREYLTQHPDADAGMAARALGLHDRTDTQEEIRRVLLRERVCQLLMEDFTLDEKLLADRLAASSDEIAAVLARAKVEAARRRVALLFENSVTERDEILSTLLGQQKGRRNADRRDVVAAYNRRIAFSAMSRAFRPIDSQVAARLSRAVEIIPPLAPLTEAALDVAAVNFRADEDGTVRRVPVLIDSPNGAIAHLGLSAAVHGLELNLSEVSLDTDGLRVSASSDATARRLPLDRDGAMVIHWTGTAGDWRRGRDMPHIPAAKLMAIVDARRGIRDNEIAMKYLLAEVVAAAKGEFTVAASSEEGAADVTRSADALYRGRILEMVELERFLNQARLQQTLSPEEIAARRNKLDRLRAELDAEEQQAAATVEITLRELDEIPQEEIDADPQLAADAKRFRAAKRIIDVDLAELRRANETLQRSIEGTQAELADHLGGKFVFLGFAATAQGDIVTSPIDPRTNGVMCHAHVLNAILQNRPIRHVPAWVGVLICMAGGAFVSVVTSTQPPRRALLATIGLSAAYFYLNCEVLFKRMDIWVALAAPLICIFVTWAFVTLYRQLTAEREKRLFAKQLGQYTSPIIAARIAENPQAAQAFKTVQTREVTCYFSDLKGFTTLTEEEDPEIIQRVLNTYLHRMSQVIWDQRGLLNKFMGDGVMAFFNASVDPMTEHARAAVEAALTGMEELERLKEERKGDAAARLFTALQMRVGLASGPAMNGDMGSELKADYTVIGDVVNLAARLEPANKVFGTSIMVSGPTRDIVLNDYEFRYLAELQVKGKARTVPVYEVVCRKGKLTDEQREYIARFEAGVELYKQRKWDECIVHFTRILSRRFDDAGASRYIDACQELKTFPPDEDWRGALELKEK